MVFERRGNLEAYKEDGAMVLRFYWFLMASPKTSKRKEGRTGDFAGNSP